MPTGLVTLQSPLATKLADLNSISELYGHGPYRSAHLTAARRATIGASDFLSAVTARVHARLVAVAPDIGSRVLDIAFRIRAQLLNLYVGAPHDIAHCFSAFTHIFSHHDLFHDPRGLRNHRLFHRLSYFDGLILESSRVGRAYRSIHRPALHRRTFLAQGHLLLDRPLSGAREHAYATAAHFSLPNLELFFDHW